jgi:hypothetical protein
MCIPAAYNLAKVGPAMMIPIDWDTDMAVYRVATCSAGVKEVATLIIETTNGMESDTNRHPIVSGIGSEAMKIKK